MLSGRKTRHEAQGVKMTSIVFNAADRAFQADLENRDPQLYSTISGLISGWSISQIASNQGIPNDDLVSYLQDPARLPDIKKVANWWLQQKASYGMVPSELAEIIPDIYQYAQ